tara:strand:- start:2095 stop:3861 length:1767 start_codon:yes stop_codon:yes gene_type:complete
MNNIQSQVKNIASRGRYGDTTLVHMNPTEVAGLAQMGAMTINPQTGLAEAFGFKDLIPIAASIVGGVFGGPVGAGLGSGLATGILEGDLKKGIAAGLTSYGFGSILQGAGAAAKGAEAASKVAAEETAKAAAQAGTEELTSQALGSALEELGSAGTEALVQEVGKEALSETAKAGIAEASQAAGEAATQSALQAAKDSSTSLLTSAKDAFTPVSGAEGFGKFTSVFDNLAAGASQPAAYLPIGIGGSALGMMEAQEQYEEDLAEGQRQDLLQREYEAMMRPEPILFSATGGLTQFVEGGDTKPQVISRQKRPYAVNTNYLPGLNPEILYFDPATLNPAAQTIMGDGTPAFETINPMVSNQDIYSNVSRGGFDMPSQGVPTQNVIDPYQKYTGVAPPPLLNEPAIAGPAMNYQPLAPIPLSPEEEPDMLEDLSALEKAAALKGAFLFNEGGDTSIDPLIKEAKGFIMGETSDDTVVKRFIEKYGTDAFLALREEVLQSLIPNAQTEGLIAGKGNGGMDDDLRGNIGGKETIAVSQDEFIVPADVVSMLGDGSSDAGAKELYNMMDRVRTEKYGTKEQAKPIDSSKVLPA